MFTSNHKANLRTFLVCFRHSSLFLRDKLRFSYIPVVRKKFVVSHYPSIFWSIGWQLSTWNCYKPFFSLLYNCQLLCFWPIVSSTVVKVFLQLFFRYCLFSNIYYKLVMPNYMPYPWVASIFNTLRTGDADLRFYQVKLGTSASSA
jgi:hypothetical protein